MSPPRSRACLRTAWPWPVAACVLAACGGGGGGGGGGGITPGAAAPGPDLVLEDVTFGPTSLTAGASITTSDTVRNLGDQPALGFQVGVYLSDDAVITPTDVLLGFRTVGSLASGAASIGGGSLTIPITTLGGSYWVGAFVDDLGATVESNETNNSLAAAVTLDVTMAPLPDLEGSAVSFQPLVVDAGDTVDVTDTVANTGSLLAQGVVVGLYLSSDATITNADVLLGFRSLASLDIGESSTATTQVVVPLNTLAGLYHVGVLADDANAHPEHDETNNAFDAPVLLQVNAPPRPDLVPSGISFGPSVIDAGDQIYVSDAVLNQGAANAGAFRIGIYLSQDGLVSSADTRIAERFVSGLALGLTSAVSSIPVTIPIDTPAGSWFVGVLVDDAGVLAELDESNNALAAFATLQVKRPPTPDLAISAVSFTPTSVQPALGEIVTLTDTVRNEGILPAGAFRVAFYVSTNPLVTTGDIFVASRSVSGLAVGDSSTGITPITLPPGLGAGSYFLGAIADDEDLVLEVVFANNALTSPVPLDVIAAPNPMPQLVVESVSFTPTTVAKGGMIQVQDVVRNHGTQSATSFRVGIYLSTDSDITASDVKIGERTVSGLAIGFGSATSAPYTVPAGTPPGIYRIGAVCDIAAEIAESDEGDNALAALGYLTVN